MDIPIGYVAVAFLPLTHLQLPNPVGLAWYAKYGNVSMIERIQRRAVTADLLVRYGQQATLAALLSILASRAHVTMSVIGRTPDDPIEASLKGFFFALGWLSVYLCLLIRLKPTKLQLQKHQILHYPATTFVPLTLLSAGVEEVWRALCLVLLEPRGTVLAVAVTTGRVL